MRRQATVPLLVGGVIYTIFAASCFHLAVIHDYETGISIGEGMFTLVGAAALFTAVARPRWQAVIVAVGTVPLVGWFAATPWNSGRPFLLASIIAPAIAAAAAFRQTQLRRARG